MRTGATYPLGTVVRLTGTFIDDTGTPVDPTDVVCSVQDPAGERTTPDVTKTETGRYIADIDTPTPGPWYYRFDGTGDNKAPTPDGTFRVSPTLFA